ncbi:hypothetical protein [Amycolatopsis jiangsuensis]|uniref:Uncharacterized protein n=1 Tax=Amycolatopsis jiangsuensis TaxID=1181879 RepID=A0A840IRM8_9PSEU|nr:hypothetical protein [Amycolatopsis jiangsuensis]MBB4684189.1 hypothetical protein [Amycolatopsis jiangsuensis]
MGYPGMPTPPGQAGRGVQVPLRLVVAGVAGLAELVVLGIEAVELIDHLNDDLKTFVHGVITLLGLVALGGAALTAQRRLGPGRILLLTAVVQLVLAILGANGAFKWSRSSTFEALVYPAAVAGLVGVALCVPKIAEWVQPQAPWTGGAPAPPGWGYPALPQPGAVPQNWPGPPLQPGFAAPPPQPGEAAAPSFGDPTAPQPGFPAGWTPGFGAAQQVPSGYAAPQAPQPQSGFPVGWTPGYGAAQQLAPGCPAPQPQSGASPGFGAPQQSPPGQPVQQAPQPGYPQPPYPPAGPSSR